MTRTLNMHVTRSAPRGSVASASAGIEPPVIERAAGDGAFELAARAARAAPCTSSIEASPPDAITGIEIASASAMVASS